MRLILIAVLLLIPCLALAEDEPAAKKKTAAKKAAPKGPSESALIWARDTVAERLKDPQEAQDFTSDLTWLNVRDPLYLGKELRGKIVLLDFWTYCCINCIHILPDLEYLEAKYGSKGLVVIGVHSAKFENEKDVTQIREAIQRYEIHHPVVVDKMFSVWHKYGARSWPTFALVAPDGTYIGRLSGEGRREELEALIVALLEQFEGKIDTKPVPLRLEREQRPAGQLNYPGKITVAADGKRMWIADSNHNRIVEVDAAGTFLRAFGDGQRGLQDGAPKTARFFRPQGMDVHDGGLYVCDTQNHALRRIDLASGAVTTVAGTGEQGSHWKMLRDLDHAPRRGTETALNSPWDILFVRGTGYVAMAGSHTLWTFDPKAKTVSPFAGDGSERRLDAKDLRKAAFAQPSGLAFDGKHLYVADSESSAIVRVGLKEGVTTLAGGSAKPTDLFHYGDVDGKGLGRRFQHPLGIGFHGGLLYVADSYNHKIKTVDPTTGEVRTIIGTGGRGQTNVFRGESFMEPSGLAVHGDVLFVADTNNHVIRRIDLKTHKATTLKLTGVPVPRRHAKVGGMGAAWPELADTVYNPALEVTVRAGAEVPVTLDLQLPAGWKLTKDAPSVMRVRLGAKSKDVKITTLSPKGTLPPLTPGRHDLHVRVLYYVCQDEGDCRVRSVYWPLRVTAKPGGAQAATLSDRFEP